MPSPGSKGYTIDTAMRPRKADALEKLATLVEAIVHPNAKVVALR
jgi:hypothetical protein